MLRAKSCEVVATAWWRWAGDAVRISQREPWRWVFRMLTWKDTWLLKTLRYKAPRMGCGVATASWGKDGGTGLCRLPSATKARILGRTSHSMQRSGRPPDIMLQAVCSYSSTAVIPCHRADTCLRKRRASHCVAGVEELCSLVAVIGNAVVHLTVSRVRGHNQRSSRCLRAVQCVG